MAAKQFPIKPSNALSKPRLRVITRFVKKVSAIGHANGCWLWKGYKDAKGYGQFHLEGATQWAHRVAFAIWNGSIEAGMEVNHKKECLNPSCVNPAHLEKVTKSENVADGNERILRGAVGNTFKENYICTRCGGTQVEIGKRDVRCLNCGHTGPLRKATPEGEAA